MSICEVAAYMWGGEGGGNVWGQLLKGLAAAFTITCTGGSQPNLSAN